MCIILHYVLYLETDCLCHNNEGGFTLPSDPIWGPLLLQFVLIFLNAFFACSEIAILQLSENKLRKQAEEGNKKAEKLLALASAPNKFLSTIQIGITLAGFLGAAFAADNFASLLADWLLSIGVTMGRTALNTLCVIFITIILSYFTLILGELVPKRVAMQKSEAIANIVGPVILSLSAIFRPIVFFLSKSTNGALRLMGLNPNAQGEEVTEEEIRLMVDIGGETGAIDTAEREMIENIFEFNNISAEDVMTHRTDVQSIWVDEETDEILKTISETGLSRFPVYDEDNDDIVGILNTRDYLISLTKEAKKGVRELMRPAYFVPESVQADVLFRDMQKSKVHMAIVVDEYGGMAGIVTMEDLLEEIVGNIYDEFDPPKEMDIEQIEDDLWRVSGTADLESLEEAMDIEIPQKEEYDTLGGLVFSQFSSIPQDGSQPEVTIGQMKISVETVLDHRVESALVRKLTKDKEATEEKED
jgi:Hemolysins and related proteins containing CBS domains